MAIPSVTIVIVPVDGGGIEVQVNGEKTGYFSNPSYAAVAYANNLIAYRELHDTVMDHIHWMNSRTPEQVGRLDAGTLRAIAEDLKIRVGQRI